MTKFGNDLQNYVQMNPSVCLHPIRACQDMPDGSIYCTDCKTQVRPASEKPIDRISSLEAENKKLREALAYVDYASPVVEGTTLEDHETVEVVMTVKGIKDIRALLEPKP